MGMPVTDHHVWGHAYRHDTHIGNEEKKFHKKRLCKPLLHKMWKRQTLFHSPMCSNQPLRMMELGAYRAIIFPTSFMWWNSDSPKYLVPHVNGYCEGTCVNTKLCWFLHAHTLFKRISFIIVEHGMDHIVEHFDNFFKILYLFMDPWHISNDIESNNDGEDEHLKGDDGIMEFNGLMTIE
jgi:hypothetical protein